MRAGELRHRITIQKPSTDLDAGGAPNPTWSNVATVPAKRVDPGGREDFEQTGELATGRTRWTIRHRSDVTARNRVVDAVSTGDVYDVIAALDPTGRRERLVLETERRGST